MPTLSRDKQFAFKIEIDGIPRVAFKTCSELEMAVGSLSIREGGKLIAEKEAGLITFPDITIGGARISDRSFYDWMLQICNAISGYAEAAGATYMRTFDVVQLDRDGSELRRYRVVNAWPNNRKIGPWDNDAEEYVLETIVFSADYWYEVV